VRVILRAERLGAAAKAERMRKEDLGEQTLARLMTLPKEAKGGGEKGVVSGSVIFERVAAKDAKDCVDEGSKVAEESKEKGAEKGNVAKASLLDRSWKCGR
jgi:hypothetical protein